MSLLLIFESLECNRHNVCSHGNNVSKVTQVADDNDETLIIQIYLSTCPGPGTLPRALTCMFSVNVPDNPIITFALQMSKQTLRKAKELV